MRSPPKFRPFGAVFVWFLAACSVVACKDDPPELPPAAEPRPAAVDQASTSKLASKPKPAPGPRPDEARAEEPDPKQYAWLANEALERPKATDTVYSRFAAPPGYKRVDVKKGSFGAWLRHLPLAPEGTRVMTHEGEPAFPEDDSYVAAVVAIDVGGGNLQLGPDVVIRLHAEWLWSRGEADQLSYDSTTKLSMPFERWMRGERIVSHAGKVFWARANPPEEVTHQHLRDYLDKVFNWVNSQMLLSQSSPIDPAKLRPGDFLVHDGKPGDAVLLVDMAIDKENNRTVVMLARALSPAQNVQIASVGRKIPWFSIAPPTPLLTPHTDEFGWEHLRRLD